MKPEYSWHIFEKILKCQISWKSIQWEPSFSMRTDRQTDRNYETNSRFSQFCERAPLKTFPCTAITDWFLQSRRSVFTARYVMKVLKIIQVNLSLNNSDSQLISSAASSRQDLSSLLIALPSFHPSFTRRMSGHCLWTFRAVYFPASQPPADPLIILNIRMSLISSLICKTLKLKIKKYRTIILFVVLYGCETWSLTLRKESTLRVFENRVVRRLFGPKRDKVTGNGENYIMRSLLICTPYTILCGW